MDKLTKLYPPDKQSSDDKLIPKKVKNMATDEDFYLDYLVLFKVLKLMYPGEVMTKSVQDVEPCDLTKLSPLLSLAMGSKVNKQAVNLYDAMMEVAKWKGRVNVYMSSVCIG